MTDAVADIPETSNGPVGLPGALARAGVHYGWLVAAATFFTMLATACAMGSAGILIPALQTEFGWTTAQISGALAVRLVLYGLMAPFAAVLLRRFGVRPVILSALSLITLGLLASLAMRSPTDLLLSWGVLVGLGTGMTAMVLGATVATRWFTQRRGLVVGCLSASTATGQLVFVPLLASVTSATGWRSAVIVVIAVQAVAALCVALVMRNYPSEVGLPPYGERAVVVPPVTDLRWRALVSGPFTALRTAVRTPVFWVLFGTFFVCGFSTNGLVQTHWISLCGDFGILPVGAAKILATIGVFDFVGTLLSGWLSDRFDNRRLLFVFYGLRGVSLIALPYTQFGMAELWVFAVFYGLDWVATVPPTVKWAAEAYGREQAPLVFGWVFTGHQLGAATAAFGAGLTRTLLGTYVPAFQLSGVACLLAALLVLRVAGVTPRARVYA